MKKFFLIGLISLILFSGCTELDLANDLLFKNPQQCSSTGGLLLIVDYDFDSESIQLKIQNETAGEIEIFDFDGSPQKVTWQNREDSILKKSEAKTFFMKTTLSGEISQDITIYYYDHTGSKKQEKTNCIGHVDL